MGFWGFDISQWNGKGHGHGHGHTHRAKNVVEWSSRKALQWNISDQQPKKLFNTKLLCKFQSSCYSKVRPFEWISSSFNSFSVQLFKGIP